MSRQDYSLAWPLKFTSAPEVPADAQIRRTAAGLLVVETPAGARADFSVGKLKLGSADDAELIRTAAGVVRVQTGAGALARIDDTTKNGLASVRRLLLSGEGWLGAGTAGSTRGFVTWNSGGTSSGLQQYGANAALAMKTIYLDAAEWDIVPGKTPKLVLTGEAFCNATASGTTLSYSVRLISSTGGAAGGITYNNTSGALFALSMNGGAAIGASRYYAISAPQDFPASPAHASLGQSNASAIAASSWLGLNAQLWVVYV